LVAQDLGYIVCVVGGLPSFLTEWADISAARASEIRPMRARPKALKLALITKHASCACNLAAPLQLRHRFPKGLAECIKRHMSGSVAEQNNSRLAFQNE
jgi:hypothetical protein